MKIDEALILKLERLSRLKLSPDERTKMQSDLEKILGLCNKLNEVDTDGVEPLIYMGAKKQRLRKDEVKGMISRLDALKNAQHKDDQYFKVPKVIKSKS